MVCEHGSMMCPACDGITDDDEPFTEEEQAEVAEAQERIARGEGVPLEEA